MVDRQRQRGLSLVGFIFVTAIVIGFVMVGFRVVPAYIEWFSVKKVMEKTLADSKDVFSITQFRRDFDLKASADYIDSVRGTDIDVAKEGNSLVATANWTRTLHLFGNVSLLLDFEATATK
jgi:hypothetical protein